ncbi:MAG: hypothetical protein D6690_02210 [Nitrospirae bacterium]|nr:MAG: hypothetical protein D6690_02210 [Nitrospirota bacterium]
MGRLSPDHPARAVGSWMMLALVSLFVTSCTTGPTLHAVPLDPEQSEQILTAIASREERLSMMQGLFQVAIGDGRIPLATQSMNGVLYYQRPRFIRLKGLTQFGGIVFDFVQQGDRFTLQVPGMVSQPLVGTLDQLDEIGEFGRPIRLALQAMGPMLGTLTQENPRILVFQEENRYRLDVYRQKHDATVHPHIRVWVNGSYEPLRLAYLDAGGDPILVVRYDHYQRVSSLPLNAAELRLPYHVQARDLEQSLSVTMTFIEILATVG